MSQQDTVTRTTRQHSGAMTWTTTPTNIPARRATPLALTTYTTTTQIQTLTKTNAPTPLTLNPATPSADGDEAAQGSSPLPSPILGDSLHNLLVGHKDRAFLQDGFKYGFRLGYEGDLTFTQGKNALSVNLNLQVVLAKTNSDD